MTPILHPYAMRVLAPAGGIYDPLSPPGGLRIGYQGIYAATPARMILLRSYGPNVVIHPIVRPAAGIEPAVTLAPGAQNTVTITPPPSYSISPVWAVIGAVSTGLSAYHGYRRNDSLGWGIGWGLLGGLFPIVTPAIAFAQGFGKRKRAD